VPKTKIIKMPEKAQKVIWGLFDGNEGDEADRKPLGYFIEELIAAATDMGFPCFLRTDHTSAKHSWEDTCFVKSVSDLMGHVYQIAEASEIADMIGLPWDTWAVREFLPTIPIGVCSRYGNMPVCREFRYFIEDGRYVCSHPYWPMDSLIDGGFDISQQEYDALCSGRTQELDQIAIAAGRAIGGAWSVDVLDTQRGWFVTDMAEAHKSFHWAGCKNEKAFRRQPVIAESFDVHRSHLSQARLGKHLLREIHQRSHAARLRHRRVFRDRGHDRPAVGHVGGARVLADNTYRCLFALRQHASVP